MIRGGDQAEVGSVEYNHGGDRPVARGLNMLITRVFLTLIGVIYVYLAAWCSLMPSQTSQLVGFDLKPGSGQSEFLVIYGGLELGMALIFLMPLIRPQRTESSLSACLVIHACLVAFRSASFMLYSGISSMTRQLAFYEWLIFLAAAGLTWAEIKRGRSV